jgi:uncharacterized membrane protein
MSNNHHPGWLYILGLLIACVIIDIGLFAWGINRGLDIKDESFMLTCYRYPQLYAGLTTSFHFIINRLFGAFDWGVLQYRLIGFFWRLLAASCFAYGFWRWLLSTMPEEKVPSTKTD